MSCNQGHRLPRKEKKRQCASGASKTQYALRASQRFVHAKSARASNKKIISQLAYKHLKAYKLITRMINDKEMINDKWQKTMTKNQDGYHVDKDKQSLHAISLTDIPNSQVI